MNRFIAVCWVLSFSVSLFFSCEKEKLPPTDTPPAGCDTLDIRYNKNIVPILERYCFDGCHNGINPSSGISLDTYAAVKVKIDEGRFLGAVQQLPGFVAMPLGAPPIPECDLTQIRIWIEAGAPNN